MLKHVNDELDLAYYNFIWMTAWREKGYEFEFSKHVLNRFLVVSTEGQYIGTAEYVAFHPSESAFASVVPKDQVPELWENPSIVAEIDKFAILPEHRGKYVNELVSSTIYVARERGIRYFVSLLEPLFYRALRFLFRAPMTVIGPKIFYKGDYVLPVVIDMSEPVAKPDKFGIPEPSLLLTAGRA